LNLSLSANAEKWWPKSNRRLFVPRASNDYEHEIDAAIGMQTVPHGHFIPLDLIIRRILAELMKHVEMYPSCRHQIINNISLLLEHCRVYRMKN
jgi:hypothetical protein